MEELDKREPGRVAPEIDACSKWSVAGAAAEARSKKALDVEHSSSRRANTQDTRVGHRIADRVTGTCLMNARAVSASRSQVVVYDD